LARLPVGTHALEAGPLLLVARLLLREECEVVMSRRAALAGIVLAPSVLAETPVRDVFLCGDSLAWQWISRLGPALKLHGKTLTADAQGGTSVRWWLRSRRFERAAAKHRAALTVISLAVNCTHSERAGLADDMAALVKQARSPVLWVLPNQDGYAFSLAYAYDAARDAGVELWVPPPLPLESDHVHFTHLGYQQLSARLCERLYGVQ
jgi:hypothetical protein